MRKRPKGRLTVSNRVYLVCIVESPGLRGKIVITLPNLHRRPISRVVPDIEAEVGVRDTNFRATIVRVDHPLLCWRTIAVVSMGDVLSLFNELEDDGCTYI